MLLAHRNDKRLPQRSLHVHAIRKKFQTQLKNLWRSHPVLAHLEHPLIDLSVIAPHTKIEDNPVKSIERYGYSWLPIVQRNNGLVCELDILMLREGSPGGALHDIDNRLKTVFDALRMANGPQELGAGRTGSKLPGRMRCHFVFWSKMTGSSLRCQSQPICYWSQYPMLKIKTMPFDWLLA
jgi:hypothetical protein